MLNEMYTVLFIISLILLMGLMSAFKHRISHYYVLLFASILVINMGYMQLSDAQNLNAALYANQVVYLGSSFTPFFLVMCMADLCKIQVKRRYQLAFILFGCFLFTLSSSVGVVPWFYKSIDLVQRNGVTYVVKDYGPLHVINPIYSLTSATIGFAFIIRSFRRRRDVSYITSTLLMAAMMLTVGTYIAEKAFHLEVELMPIAYVVAETGLFFLLRRISLYDISVISTDSMVESDDYGFVLSDSKGKYLGGDVAAKNWFPEIRTLQIDARIKEENTEFLQLLGKWNRGEEQKELVYLNSGDRVIEAKHTILKDGATRTIHCVYLRDDTANQEYTKLMEKYQQALEQDVTEKKKRISHIQNDIIISMASIVENRDNNTGGHIARTSDIMRIFVKHLLEKGTFEEMTEIMAKRIIKAAPLHDFGKIAIPDVVLNKPGKFTDEEYALMKTHSAKGAAIVERILQNVEDEDFRTVSVNVAHYHHERWDGRGYPEGLKLDEIPFEARVMALADVFDALVSKRVYKESYSYDRAFLIIAESCGTQFDPELCKAFLECRPLLEDLYNSYED